MNKGRIALRPYCGAAKSFEKKKGAYAPAESPYCISITRQGQEGPSCRMAPHGKDGCLDQGFQFIDVERLGKIGHLASFEKLHRRRADRVPGDENKTADQAFV